MNVWVELWVRLKVVDLVAQTAWLTLTEKLDFAGRIHGLLRYSYWGFTAEGSAESIMEEIDRVVRMDSTFTNQNKHRYRLMIVEDVAERGVQFGDGVETRRGLPLDTGTNETLTAGTHEPPAAHGRGDLPLEHDYTLEVDANGAASGSLFALDCLVRECDGDREKAFTDRLNGRVCGVSVSGMKAGEVWRIIVSAGSAGEALETAGRIAVTRSRREGLLLNPHYQRLELISAVLLSPQAAGKRGD